MLQTHKYIVSKNNIIEFFDDFPGVKRIIIYKGSRGNLSDSSAVKCSALIDFDRRGWMNTIVGSCKEHFDMGYPLFNEIKNCLQRGIVHQGDIEKLIEAETHFRISFNIYSGVREFVLLHPKTWRKF